MNCNQTKSIDTTLLKSAFLKKLIIDDTNFPKEIIIINYYIKFDLIK